jgi:arylformamidase
MILYLDSANYIDTNQPLDISIPMVNDDTNLRAWYVDSPQFEPVVTEQFTGLIAKGGSVNFRNIIFNPHGHGTHTECLGHITEEIHSVNKSLKTFFFKAQVISVQPEERILVEGQTDWVVSREILQKALHGVDFCEALVIRTLPNEESKKHRNYSSSNPAYFDANCVELLNTLKVKHVLVDLPSVDREEDGGALAFHHAFWGVPDQPQFHKTITEFIYVGNEISDGPYVLNMQTAPFENDATPSRPVLYRIENIPDLEAN